MYKVGDILIGKHRSNKGVERRIIEVLPDPVVIMGKEYTTYLWEYPDLPSSESNVFYSGNSTDPSMDVTWEVKR